MEESLSFSLSVSKLSIWKIFVTEASSVLSWVLDQTWVLDFCLRRTEEMGI